MDIRAFGARLHARLDGSARSSEAIAASMRSVGETLAKGLAAAFAYHAVAALFFMLAGANVYRDALTFAAIALCTVAPFELIFALRRVGFGSSHTIWFGGLIGLVVSVVLFALKLLLPLLVLTIVFELDAALCAALPFLPEGTLAVAFILFPFVQALYLGIQGIRLLVRRLRGRGALAAAREGRR